MKRKLTYAGLGIVVIFILAILEYTGIIWHNEWFARPYEVKGLDVSHHQGKIDWRKVKEEKEYDFVYIKATEGKDFVDDRLRYNWNEAKRQGIMVGAYHFFSMRSSGETQALHYIRIVPKEKDSLPPVIDVEIHLGHNRERVRRELRAMAIRLQQHYGKQPILYVTYDTYNTYIKDDFQEYRIWIRDIFKPPSLDERSWSLWQYSNRGRVDGIPTYVDINAFCGDIKAFRREMAR
ncbi:glycoside hydrolase family 25 [Polycladomyces abyssicola]|uniref:Glycoside hydrolase family 25 n=1 Tax=Polycladomyces abyssicola TaxID=1125966 RepID=A0A8D5ZLU4_9BACL|nr:GH25 family lysozyme [Polycladomyces abyssicola]BCU80955.1 glycoside hydrolase family 25 [Polycladomyces abyssicola]